VCTSALCKNDGRCEDLPNGHYACHCVEPWTGTNCETGITTTTLPYTTTTPQIICKHVNEFPITFDAPRQDYFKFTTPVDGYLSLRGSGATLVGPSQIVLTADKPFSFIGLEFRIVNARYATLFVKFSDGYTITTTHSLNHSYGDWSLEQFSSDGQDVTDVVSLTVVFDPIPGAPEPVQISELTVSACMELLTTTEATTEETTTP